MTDSPHHVVSDDSSGFESFADLRLAHVNFRRRFSDPSPDSAAGPSPSDQIRAFVSRISKTGELLIDERERHEAEAILDFWRNELMAAGKLTASDYTVVLLAKPRPTSASHEEAAYEKRSRDVLRLVSGARLWKDSGRKQGYLLFGQAIDEAARYRHEDADIDDWVAASEAEHAGRKKWNRIVFGGIAATVVVVLCVLALIQIIALPMLQSKFTFWMKDAPGPVQQKNLSRLGRMQFLLPPYDLSTVDRLQQVKLPGLVLHAPNFSSARLQNVDFEGANLKNISLSEGIVETSNFKNAVLDFALFRAARMKSTSFSRAELYRAVFDRTCLTDVDFSSADLRLASFGGARIGTESKNFGQLFEHSGWWHATGWSSQQIQALLASDQSKITGSLGYENAMKDARASFDTSERSEALNNLAWMLATWGAIGEAPARAEGGAAAAVQRDCSTVGDSKTIPRTALDAVEQALCIATARRQNADDVANFSDTKAYILMQTPGRMQDAAQIYRSMASSEGALFRWAVAQYALGDSNGALANLNRSIRIEKYLPTHELHTLKKHIKGEFERQLYRFIDDVFPTPMHSPCDIAPDSVNPSHQDNPKSPQ